MDYFYYPSFNGSSDLDNSDDYSENCTEFGNLFKLYQPVNNGISVTAWIVISAAFPLCLLAIYSLYSLVQQNQVAPVFVINLLISDLIQICCFVVRVAERRRCIFLLVSTSIYCLGVVVSVGFMMCIALERFLVIACPLWYRFKRNIKFSIFVSVGVWVLGFIQFLVVVLTRSMIIFHSIFLLLPFPVFIFCLVGTLKSLSSAISVTPKEKWQIIGTLVLVLLIYTLLFLPWIISVLRDSFNLLDHSALYLSFPQFSPLADLVLYVFMRKGAVGRLVACMCCCRRTGEHLQNQVTTTNNTEGNSVVMEQGRNIFLTHVHSPPQLL
ncbi:G-protein coupled receptor 4-like [Channa argus]|uniref:G-protein coupled receptor 4-like n=1 Tax=Channa argus TaxID=215402 RepID=UPI003521C5A1